MSIKDHKQACTVIRYNFMSLRNFNKVSIKSVLSEIKKILMHSDKKYSFVKALLISIQFYSTFL